MHRRTIIKAAATAILVASPAVRAAKERAPALPRVGAAFPLVDVPLIEGGTFRASEAQGQVVVIYWWASWCPFCALQSPHIQKLWDAQRARGLKVLGISIDRRIEDARRYLTQKGYTFPSGFSSPAIEPALRKPGDGLPVTCVRGRDGRIVLAESGQMFPEDVEEIARFV